MKGLLATLRLRLVCAPQSGLVLTHRANAENYFRKQALKKQGGRKVVANGNIDTRTSQLHGEPLASMEKNVEDAPGCPSERVVRPLPHGGVAAKAPVHAVDEAVAGNAAHRPQLQT